jgi:uncharacterized protein YlaI
MTPLCWLYLQHEGIMLSGNERCYLCGVSCTEAHDIQKSIADTFNSHYLARAPSSRYLCDACHWYLDSKAGHADFRKMSLIVSRHTWRNWQQKVMKQDIREWLEDGLPEESYLVVSLTKKKHILLQAPLNGKGSKRLAIQIEEQMAHVDLCSWTAIEVSFMRLIALGHGKGEILRGELYCATLRKHGQLLEAMKLSDQLNEWRHSPIITLYSYITPLEGRDDRDTESYGDSSSSITTSASYLDSDQHTVQDRATTNHLVTNGEQHGKHSQYEQHSTGVHQQTLW